MNSILRLVLTFSVVALMSGCGTPSYTSSMRTNFDAETPLELQCIRYLDRRAGDFREKAEEMYREGWRIAYMSEYTSSKKAKFALLGCFERPRTQ